MSYAAQCRALAEELAQSLDATGRQAARDAVQALGGPTAWMQWRSAHASAVAGYVLATPARRRSLRHALPQPLLVLAAYQHCLHAAELLDAAVQLPPRGASYRGMAAEVGTLAAQLHDPVLDWPWDAPDPFDD